jgi:hypothetical protein
MFPNDDLYQECSKRRFVPGSFPDRATLSYKSTVGNELGKATSEAWWYHARDLEVVAKSQLSLKAPVFKSQTRSIQRCKNGGLVEGHGQGHGQSLLNPTGPYLT